ncbi:MAG: thiol-disulfide oxidoreductase DCC family protein [Aestuariibacter sp.]
MQLVIFYDGQCPLCLKEMQHLRRLDQNQRLTLIDIFSERFSNEYPEMQDKPVLQKLHGYLVPTSSSDTIAKQMLTGLDVTYHAWRLVGRGWIVKPLRWPLLKPIADGFYLWFAKHRFSLSYLLTGQKRCKPCQIKEKS